MPRSSNEIMTEYHQLGRAGQVTFDDFQRLWREMDSNLRQRQLQDWQRQDVLSGLAAFAEPEWFDRVEAAPDMPTHPRKSA